MHFKKTSKHRQEAKAIKALVASAQAKAPMMPALYFTHGLNAAKQKRLGYKHLYALAYEGVVSSNDRGEFHRTGNYMVYSNLPYEEITHELLQRELRMMPDTNFMHDCDDREDFQKLLRYKLSYINPANTFEALGIPREVVEEALDSGDFGDNSDLKKLFDLKRAERDRRQLLT
jgi:hypothetical protein